MTAAFEMRIGGMSIYSSGAMVAWYTNALSGELAVIEFQRNWG
jgi:hypothetical protein